MNFILFLLPYLVTGFFITLLALTVEGAMIKIGWTPGNTLFLAILTFIASIILELAKFPQPISLEIVDMVIVLIATPLIANLLYLVKTIRAGRWWWQLEDDLIDKNDE